MSRKLKSPFDGDLTYWSERDNKLYDGITSKAVKKQNHSCAFCGHKLLSDEKINFIVLMEITTTGRMITWPQSMKAAMAIRTQGKSLEYQELDAPKGACPDLIGRDAG